MMAVGKDEKIEEAASLFCEKEKLFLCQKEYEITRTFQRKMTLREMAQSIARILLEEEMEELP